MVFENPNDRALLEVELEKHGLTLKQLEGIVDATIPIVSRVIEVAAEIAVNVIPVIIEAVSCTYPKYWHYYKHAKKLRTRKKYRNKLWKIATAAIKKGALI